MPATTTSTQLGEHNIGKEKEHLWKNIAADVQAKAYLIGVFDFLLKEFIENFNL